MILPPHRLDVDFSERHAAILHLALQSACFDVRLVRLEPGGSLIDNAVPLEKKHRPVGQSQGPSPADPPRNQPHALDGAIISQAVPRSASGLRTGGTVGFFDEVERVLREHGVATTVLSEEDTRRSK